MNIRDSHHKRGFHSEKNVIGGWSNYLHIPCLKLIWGHGIVQRQQCYLVINIVNDSTCEDSSHPDQ